MSLLAFVIASLGGGCMAAVVDENIRSRARARREASLARSENDLPPAFEDAALARYRTLFLADRRRILARPAEVFEERGLGSCAVEREVLGHLLLGKSFGTANDDEVVDLRRASVVRLEHDCPGRDRAVARFRVSYSRILRGRATLWTTVDSVRHGLYENGLARGPVRVFARTRFEQRGQREEVLSASYGVDDETTESLEGPCVVFEFHRGRPGVTTRALLPGPDGRAWAFHYEGAALTGSGPLDAP